jgi:hypothetical protein
MLSPFNQANKNKERLSNIALKNSFRTQLLQTRLVGLQFESIMSCARLLRHVIGKLV